MRILRFLVSPVSLIATLSVIALIVSVAAVAGTTIAEKAEFAHITAETAEDTEVVAIADGKNVTRAAIIKPAEFHRTVDPTLTTDEATMLVIVSVIDDYLIKAEVERHGLTPTDEDARTFMEPHKEACLGSNGQDCRDYITSLGLTVDDYWANALPDYKDELAKRNLFQAVFTADAPADPTNEDLLATDKAFRVQLRTNATITWNDADLKRLYEQAVASE